MNNELPVLNNNARYPNVNNPSEMPANSSERISASGGSPVTVQNLESSVANLSIEGRGVSTQTVTYHDLISLADEKINKIIFQGPDSARLALNTTLSTLSREYMNGEDFIKNIIRTLGDRELTPATHYTNDVKEVFNELIDKYIEMLIREYEKGILGATRGSIMRSLCGQILRNHYEKCWREVLSDDTGSMDTVKCMLISCKEITSNPLIPTINLLATGIARHYTPEMAIPNNRESEWRSSYLVETHGNNPIWEPLITLLKKSPFYPDSALAKEKSLPDSARCFSCGLGLAGWVASDNPMYEHARHYQEECDVLKREYTIESILALSGWEKNKIGTPPKLVSTEAIVKSTTGMGVCRKVLDGNVQCDVFGCTTVKKMYVNKKPCHHLISWCPDHPPKKCTAVGGCETAINAEDWGVVHTG